MNGCGLGDAPGKLLEQIAEVCSLDIVLPAGNGVELRLRTVSRPKTHLAILVQKLGLPLPSKPNSL